MKTVLGIDRIEEYQEIFQNKKIGLITNYSGVDSAWRSNIDVFVKHGFVISRLFTSEHGLYGAIAGAKVEDSVYPGYDIPIVSLYGEKRRPCREDVEDLELLVYDIQDVGLRYYTFIYTMTYCMEAAAECGIPFVVLDRPNPLGGRQILGGRIQKEFSCFVGDYELPIRYGLTCGELGAYFVRYRKLDLDYTVIPIKNYTREMYYPDTGLVWNIPSPALPTFESTICYSGGCFVEATNISEGRGTPKPFQMYGAPWVNMDALYDRLTEQITDGKIPFRKRSFVPNTGKYQGEICFGVEFEPRDKTFDFLPVSLILIRTVRELYPEQFRFRTTDIENRLAALAGSHMAQQYLEGKMELADVLATWNKEAASFAAECEDSRIY